MNSFTPWSALGGGVLIGTAAALWLGLGGRIAGISGMTAGLWSGEPAERVSRLAFLAGLVLGTGIWVLGWGPAPATRPHFPAALLVASGLLVGYGTALSRGCTSGHGVCGLARFSKRSLVATVVFLAGAIATTFVVRHVWNPA
jgi:uncharacterized membrane protein YedE/YeeE